MNNPKKQLDNEFEFFEKGIALVIANLDYAAELLDSLNYKDIEHLEKIIANYEEVEDYHQWEKENKKLLDFTNKIFKDEAWQGEYELFALLNEPIFLNKYMDNLLVSSDYQDIGVDVVVKHLTDNFKTTIQKVLDYPNIANYLNAESMNVLRIIERDEKVKDWAEGLGIVMLFATNTFKTLTGADLDIYTLLVEADALLSYIYFLNDDSEDLEDEE
ncbi:hypothetical protein LD118_00526 [Mesoplasma lactucae ATCC 49193]|nr:hypothetical protein MLACT_v1c03590 [Mesoplasma lactucae ATCC 49193]MCL8216929.1 hypothetical protein [Mesoplasma lactucae ATCC 49193]